MSGTPGPGLHRISRPRHPGGARRARGRCRRARYRLVNQGADGDRIAEAAKLIKAAKNPILLVGHAVHTSRSGAAVKELAELMNCPVIQTSGGTSFIPGLEDRTFPYVFSEASIDAVIESDLCLALGTELGEPSHYGRWRHWVDNEANRKWIYVQQDPTAIGVNRPIDVPLVGDLRAVVPQLVRALEGRRAARPSPARRVHGARGQADRRARTRKSQTASDGNGNVPIHTSRFVVEATKAFPKDGIMIRDGGATVIFQLDLLPVPSRTT